MKLTIRSHRSHKFLQVWEITEWKDECVYKVKPIGFISNEEIDTRNYPGDKYELSSISTSLTKGMFCTLDPYIGK